MSGQVTGARLAGPPLPSDGPAEILARQRNLAKRAALAEVQRDQCPGCTVRPSPAGAPCLFWFRSAGHGAHWRRRLPLVGSARRCWLRDHGKPAP